MNETLQLIRRHLREMWHRRWIGLMAAWIAALISIAVVYRIPERYEASARVYVDTESVLKPLLLGLAVQPNVAQQVALVSRTLISRPNVERVVRQAELDLKVTTDAGREALVNDVSRAITLTSGNQTNLYVISYRDTDQDRARKVVQSLLTIFVESSLGDKRQDSRNAVRFLDDQIRHYEQALAVAENRLKEFKLKYLAMGHRDRDTDYFGRMAAVTKNIADARMQLTRAEQARDTYKRELAGEQPTFLPAEIESVVDAPLEVDARIAALKKELDDRSLKYTDNHPDIIGAKRLIAELTEQRKQELEARRKVAPPRPPIKDTDRNPVFQQLKIQLAEAEAQVASTRAMLAGYEKQEGVLRAQAQLVPQVESEYAQLNRDYDVQKKTYESLLARRESATMGIGMQDSGGAQFRIVDPPYVAPQPVAPNRIALLGVAFVLSVLAGGMASFVASQAAPTFYDAKTLRDATNRPVLGLVSMIPSPTAAWARRRRAMVFAGGLSGLFALFATVAALSLVFWRTA